MAINANSVTAPGASLCGHLDRRDAEARQGRWMLELDRIMLSTSAGKEGFARQGHADLAQQLGPAAIPDTMRCAATSGTACGAADSPADAPGGPRGAAHMRGTATDRMHIMSPAHRAAISNESAPGTWNALAAPALFPMRFSLAPSSPEEQAEHGIRSSARLPLSAPVIGSGPHEQPAGETFAEGADPAGAAPHASQFGERPAFSKHLLSLYVRQDGVHAFIRDAALGAAQAQHVAQALSGEMAAAGQRLVALTVNGRALAAAKTGQPHGNDFPGEVRAAQQPDSQDRSSLRKGTSQ